MQMMTSYFCNSNSSESYIFEKKKKKPKEQQQKKKTQAPRNTENIRTSGVVEKYLKVVQDVYRDRVVRKETDDRQRTVQRRVSQTEGQKVDPREIWDAATAENEIKKKSSAVRTTSTDRRTCGTQTQVQLAGNPL